MSVDLSPIEVPSESPAIVPLKLNFNRRLRILELFLVLGVAFSGFILVSGIHFVIGTSITQGINSERYAHGLCSELASLAVMAYVLYRQGRSWHSLTKTPQASDLLRSVVLLVAASLLYVVTYYVIQIMALQFTGHWLQPRDLSRLFTGGASVLAILFMIVNGFFEELIVRAYLMTEVIALGSTRTAAVVASIVFQVSYHLYQGWLNAVLVGTTFFVFSLYYANTRRIGPIILAHVFIDILALFRHA